MLPYIIATVIVFTALAAIVRIVIYISDKMTTDFMRLVIIRINKLNSHILNNPDRFIKKVDINQFLEAGSFELYEELSYNEIKREYIDLFFNINVDIYNKINNTFSIFKSSNRKFVYDYLDTEFKYNVYQTLNENEKISGKYYKSAKKNMSEAEQIEQDAVELLLSKYGDDDDDDLESDPELHAREDMMNDTIDDEETYATFDDISKYDTVEYE
nr:MAG TPA: hypothetical protein [Caudoviricetes sp.]